MSNGQAQTYRFMELTAQHQLQLLRQQVLQMEQQLYGMALQEEALATRKAQAVQELERLRGQIERLLRAPADGTRVPSDEAQAFPELPAEEGAAP